MHKHEKRGNRQVIELDEVDEVDEVPDQPIQHFHITRAPDRAGAQAHEPGPNTSSTSSTSSTPAIPSTFDYALARKIAHRVVSRKKSLFAGAANIGVDDLIALGVQRIWEQHGRFDAARAKYSTWAYRVASFAIIDLYRASQRQLQSSQVERRGVTATWDEAGVIELAETAWRAAQALQTPLARAGRPWDVSHASRIAVDAVREVAGWSARETARRLRDDPQLRRALGISAKTPHFSLICRGVAKKKRITSQLVHCAISVAGVTVVPWITEDGVKLVTTKQTANILNVSQATLRAWRKRRRYLPYRRLGRAVVYEVADIEAFLQKTRVACN